MYKQWILSPQTNGFQVEKLRLDLTVDDADVDLLFDGQLPLRKSAS